MSTFVAPNIAGLSVSGGLRSQVSRTLRAVWRGMERIGQARAAAELQRRAVEYRSLNAERADWFAGLAADCRRNAKQA